MCGRFTMTYQDGEQLALELGVDPVALQDYRPRYNIAPTDQHWIVRVKYEDRQLLAARWGLVNTWAKDAKRAAAQINARADRLERSGAFKEAFAKRRCIVPADGFYEWVGAKAARQPYWFHRADGRLILFAGLHESWQQGKDDWLRTFTIITTDPNADVEPIHDRMPVILDDETADAWMQPNAKPAGLRDLLAPARDGTLIATPVSQRANSVKNDDPSVLEEVDAVTQRAML